MADRIARGTAAMLALRRARIEDGARPIGWKVGFGSPAAFELLGTDRPLVGFLTDRSVVDDGATVPVGDWTTPMLEPEIAVHLAHDVEGDATHDDVRAAVGGLSAAIELADVDVTPADPEPILAGNIYHRHVLLGPVDEDRRRRRASGAGCCATARRSPTPTSLKRPPASSTRWSG